MFAATRGCALSIDEITDSAFALGGAQHDAGAAVIGDTGSAPSAPPRAEAQARAAGLVNQAHERVRTALGWTEEDGQDAAYWQKVEAEPAWAEANKLREFCERIGTGGCIVPGTRPGWLNLETDFWCTATVKPSPPTHR